MFISRVFTGVCGALRELQPLGMRATAFWIMCKSHILWRKYWFASGSANRRSNDS